MNVRVQSTQLELPRDVSEVCTRLFEALPLSSAMPALVPVRPASAEHVGLAARAIVSPLVQHNILLAAGIWLYVDELEFCQSICQEVDDVSAAYWRAIAHRRAGDFLNSKIWYSSARRHPVFEELTHFDPFEFVDDVSRCCDEPTADLLELQRTEWAALFSYCARR